MDRNKIVNKLDSLKNEGGKTFGSSEAAMKHLKKLREESMEKKEWCSHIKHLISPTSWIYSHDFGDASGYEAFNVPDHQNFCPECGKPRPKEPEKRKLLWEVLAKADNTMVPNKGTYSKLAQAAITAVIKVWERWQDNSFTLGRFPDYLRKELMDE